MGNNSRNAPRPDYSRIDPTYRRGLLGFAEEDPAQFAKGMAVGNEAGLLDLLGMGANVFSRGMTGQPVFDQAMGNPLRESFGIDPQSAQSVAGEVLSPGGLLGAFAKAAGKGGLLAAPFFHGTPHKWKGGRPSLEFVGTGEGAQAFGHGLYFAENPGVAKTYMNVRRDLSHSAKTFLDGEPVDVTDKFGIKVGTSLDMGRLHGKDAALKYFDEFANGTSEQRKFVEDFDYSRLTTEPGSHLYEVEIPDGVVDKMLDWDAPLSEQPEIVDVFRKAFERNLAEGNNIQKGQAEFALNEMLKRDLRDIEGRALYWQLAGPDPKKASQLLNELGIPGIRYLDGSSRKAGEGTRNIVVFDPDSSIRKVKKDGKLVFERVD